MRTRICFIRHGETDWNVSKLIQGQTNIPLNKTGIEQALVLASRAASYNFSAIISSDLIRAFDTAKLVAERCGLEVKIQPLLRERHYGIFQGISADEGSKRYPKPYADYMARDLEYDFETGESLNNFTERVYESIEILTSHFRGQTIAAITHAGVLDIVYRKATGRTINSPRDFDIPNCALNWFHFDSQGWHLEAWNADHLENALMESPE